MKLTIFLWLCATLVSSRCFGEVEAPAVKELDNKRIIFLGDSITQAGGYVSYVSYYLERLYTEQKFDITGLGLSSETLSGLSEKGHAGGRFPRPCLFERLDRLLEKVKPEVIFACYGINDGIYLPLNEQRSEAFQEGVMKLIARCQEAGVERIFLITPPIYDDVPKEGKFNYDTVMAAYAEWQKSIRMDGVFVIDLHSEMRKARELRQKKFSKDKVHPGDEGHLFMAKTILNGIGVEVPEESVRTIGLDPLFRKLDALRILRWKRWMPHIGYTREKVVNPQPLGDSEPEEKIRLEINKLRK